MTPDRSSPPSHIGRYHTAQKQSRQWEDNRQVRLKLRVFETFSAWLIANGNPPLGAGLRLLDVGSGSGHFVRCCNENGLTATGVDIADGVDFESDALPHANDSQDVVTAVSVIEHLRTPAKLLTEVERVLKPGGAFIVVTPNWKYSMRDFFDDPTHVHPYSPASLRQLLGMYSYERIEIAPWIVRKPAWMWQLKHRYAFAYWCLPFRGDAPAAVPGFLKGRSASLLAFAAKRHEKTEPS